jgi:hypothetical protein
MRKLSLFQKKVGPAAKYLLAFFTIVVIIYSCKKETEQPADPASQQSVASIAAAAPSAYCVEDAENGLAYDSILKPTILGTRLIGSPYSVTTMKLAASNLTGSNTSITENKWYVRFKPTTPDQLAVLEDLDIDLFDYPLDYELVQEGDYYNDGVTPAETIPWLYAVVNSGFVQPAGITFELLKRMHVPDDYRLENEAFRITGNNVDTAGCGGGSARVIVPNVNQCDCIEPIPIECAGQCGGGGGGGLPPIPFTRFPGGSITVTDDILHVNVPVRKARVVARRFLKVDRVFTDNNGNYQFSKSFRNKVTLLLKFKNGDAIIKGLRGARLWQILMPVKINMGRYRGNINNIPFNVEDNNEVRSRGARHWAAATTHNAVQEYILDRAPAEGVGIPPAKLRILTVPGNNAGSTPMFAKRFISNLPEFYLREFVLPHIFFTQAYINSLLSILAGKVDMTIGYNSAGVTSGNDAMAELCYHEITHAAHYNKVGNSWYGNFVNAELNEINGQTSPYGPGNNTNSPVIALGESWAFHMGHFLTNRKYGALSGLFGEQGQPYFNNFPVAGLNSNLNLLEDFSPARTVADPFFWIPQGLYYDLIDVRNDFGVTANILLPVDLVSGYTTQQFFNALDADINNLPAYRIRLLSENGNNQAVNVTSLFAFYGY